MTWLMLLAAVAAPAAVVVGAMVYAFRALDRADAHVRFLAALRDEAHLSSPSHPYAATVATRIGTYLTPTEHTHDR